MGGLFSDELGIFRVRYEGEVPFSLSELEGADRLRVLTYSASQDLIKAVGLSVEQMEVILGHPIPARSLDQVLAMQTVALEELQGEVLVLKKKGLERLGLGRGGLGLRPGPRPKRPGFLEKEMAALWKGSRSFRMIPKIS